MIRSSRAGAIIVHTNFYGVFTKVKKKWSSLRASEPLHMPDIGFCNRCNI